MSDIRRFFQVPVLRMAALMLGTAAAIAGCAGRARYYDADARDYHRWNRDEVRFYVRWEGETHREHRNFDRRDRDEQRSYWRWRHEHRS